jgi:hypothetical protein
MLRPRIVQRLAALHRRPFHTLPDMRNNDMTVCFLGTNSGGGPTPSRNCSSLVADIVGDGSLWSMFPYVPTIHAVLTVRFKWSIVRKVPSGSLCCNQHARDTSGLMPSRRYLSRTCTVRTTWSLKPRYIADLQIQPTTSWVSERCSGLSLTCPVTIRCRLRQYVRSSPMNDAFSEPSE